MASINIYEPDTHLRSNIEEIVQLEGHQYKSYNDFYQFVSDTLDETPDLALCSLIHCNGSFCDWENYINSILSSPVLCLCISEHCKCGQKRPRISVPFTYEQLATGVNDLLTSGTEQTS